jgi:putative ABC transport system permease protein
MRIVDKARLRCRSLLRGRRVDAELETELRFHLDQLTDENIARGMTADRARAAAVRQMGGVVQIQEECRDMRRLNFIDDLWRDLRHTLRVLRRSPGFTAVALLTLALGIGANTAIFSVVKAVLLEPLSYREPDRIVAIQTFWIKRNFAGNVSGGDYPDLIAEPSPFAAATRYAGGELPVETNGRAEFVPAYGTDAGFIGVFQLQPVAGRLITPEEFRTKALVALVSEGFAARHFGDAHRAIGQVLHLEDNAISVVGVLPGEFHFPLKAELWCPMLWESTSRTAGNYRAVALLKPGVTAGAARTRLALVGARLQQDFPATHKDKSFTATPLKDLFVERSRMTLWLLMGAVVLVLMIACANIANLLLARATTRSREMALRAAVGAGRWRLIRQLLVESVMLSLAGGVLGLGLAFAGVRALVRLAPPNLPRLDEIRVDGAALLFTVVAALVAAVLFGLWPALRAARVELHDALKQGGARGVNGGGRGEWVRGALVSAEVTLALVLTLGAGLLFRSLIALSEVDLGYRTEGRLVLTASIPAKTEAQHLQAGATFERIFAELRRLPGVSAVAGVMGLPGGPYGSDGLYAVEGMHEFTNARFDQLPHAGFRLASPGYFAALGVPLLAGRDFNERDLYDAEPVAIVSATLARQVFAGRNPIGRRVKCGLDRDVWMRIVGVAGDMRNDNPATPPGPELYMAWRQHPYLANDLHIVVRAQTDISDAAQSTITRIDPGIPVKVGTLEQFYSDSVALPRFRTLLLIVFAAVAAALATAGVYGAMSYMAAQRRTEIGVRIALGATRGDVVSILTGSGARLAAIGLVGGLAITLAAGRVIESMLYGIRPRDPFAIAGAVLLLSGAALIAALIPALRAARVDPAMTLREE